MPHVIVKLWPGKSEQQKLEPSLLRLSVGLGYKLIKGIPVLSEV